MSAWDSIWLPVIGEAGPWVVLVGAAWLWFRYKEGGR